MRRFYKLLTILIVISGLFLYYNAFHIDTSLEDLKFSLEQTELADDIEDICSLDMPLSHVTAKEISLLRMKSFYFANLEYAISIVNTATDSSQLAYLKMALSSAIREKEEKRGYLLTKLDKVNRPIRKAAVYLVSLPRYIFFGRFLFKPFLFGHPGAGGRATDESASSDFLKKIRSVEKEEDFRSRILKYQKLIKNYAKTDRLPLIKLRLAYTYHRLGEYSKALKLYKEIVNGYPHGREGEISRILIRVLSRKDKLQKHANLLLITYSELPKDATKEMQDVLYGVGAIYTGILNLEEGKKFFKRVIKINPSSYVAIKARFNLAWISKQNHRLQGGLENLTETIAEIPYRDLLLNSRLELADIYYYQGEYGKAIDVWERIADERKHDKIAAFCLFRAATSYRHGMGKTEKAKEIFEKLKREYPRSPYGGYKKSIYNRFFIPAIIYFILAAFWPLIGLIGTVLSVPFSVSLPVYGGTLLLCDAIFAVSVAAFMLRMTVKHKWKDSVGWNILIASLPFIFIAIVSGAFSLRTVFSKVYLLRLIKYILRWMDLPIAYLFASNLIRNKKFFKAAAYFNPAAAVILSLYVFRGFIYSFLRYLGNYIPIAGSLTRTLPVNAPIARTRIGWELGSNVVGGYLAMTIPIAIALFFLTSGKLRKILLGFLSGFVLFVLLLTFSKGSMLALILGIIIWVAILARNKRTFSFLLTRINRKKKTLVFLFITMAVFSFFFFRIHNIGLERLGLSAITEGIVGKNWLFQKGLISFLNCPLIGLGPGNFAVPVIVDQSAPPILLPVHNLYLMVLCETGITGFLAYLFFLKVLLTTAVKNLNSQKQYAPSYILGSAFFVALLIFMIHGFYDTLLWRAFGIQIGINLGMLNAMSRMSGISNTKTLEG